MRIMRVQMRACAMFFMCAGEAAREKKAQLEKLIKQADAQQVEFERAKKQVDEELAATTLDSAKEDLAPAVEPGLVTVPTPVRKRVGTDGYENQPEAGDQPVEKPSSYAQDIFSAETIPGDVGGVGLGEDGWGNGYHPSDEEIEFDPTLFPCSETEIETDPYTIPNDNTQLDDSLNGSSSSLGDDSWQQLCKDHCSSYENVLGTKHFHYNGLCLL